MTEKVADELTTTGLGMPRKILVSDMILDLIMAIVTIPDAISNGVLAGVNLEEVLSADQGAVSN